MDTNKLVDNYDAKAVIFPAIVSSFPVFITMNSIVGYDKLSSYISVIIVFVPMIWLISQAINFLGMNTERNLMKEYDGHMPSTSMISWSKKGIQSDAINDIDKKRYHAFLSKAINENFPIDLDEEEKNKDQYFKIYNSALSWLRSKTRDEAKFYLVAKKLHTYAFFRNMTEAKAEFYDSYYKYSFIVLVLFLTLRTFYYISSIFFDSYIKISNSEKIKVFSYNEETFIFLYENLDFKLNFDIVQIIVSIFIMYYMNLIINKTIHIEHLKKVAEDYAVALIKSIDIIEEKSDKEEK